MTRSHIRAVLAAVPLVICNLIAFTGQLSFIRDHLHWPLIGDIGFAAGLESIAVFLAFMAHDALMAEDSAFRLRLGAYGAALVAAGLNYSHYSVHLHPTFAAVGTALMSGASPALWGVFSRRASRDALMAKGLIEPHALRLGMTRWLWHPLRATRVMWLATWDGVTDPREAVARWDADRSRTGLTGQSQTGPAEQSQTGPQTGPQAGPGPVPDVVPGPVPGAVPGPARKALPGPVPDRSRRQSQTSPRRRSADRSRTARSRRVTGETAEREFMSELASGSVPSLHQIRSRLHVGYDHARSLQGHLESVTASQQRSSE